MQMQMHMQINLLHLEQQHTTLEVTPRTMWRNHMARLAARQRKNLYPIFTHPYALAAKIVPSCV